MYHRQLPLPTAPRSDLQRGGSYQTTDRNTALLYYQQGYSSREIERVLGLCRTTVVRWAREAGVARPRNYYKTDEPEAYSKAMSAALGDVRNGCPVTHAVRFHDVSRTALTRALKKAGIAAQLPLARVQNTILKQHIMVLEQMLAAAGVPVPERPTIASKNLDLDQRWKHCR